MKTDIVQEEPKLILKYPYQAKLNQVAFVAIVAFSLIVIWILKNLIQIGTDESDRMIIAIVVVCVPILLCLIACYLYLHAVKIEVDKDNIVKYYSFESRGHSVLHFGFKLEDVEEIKVRKYPFRCSKLTMKIKNPIFYGFCKKKLEKSLSISVIADREKVDSFIQEFLNRHSDKL
mgnify:CR=1 FL=1